MASRVHGRAFAHRPRAYMPATDVLGWRTPLPLPFMAIHSA
jgi:hypothetical protein